MSQASKQKAKIHIQVAVDAGLEVVSVEQTKHLKLRLRAPDGRERMFVFPVSRGDNARGAKNAIADLRRFARGGDQ